MVGGSQVLALLALLLLLNSCLLSFALPIASPKTEGDVDPVLLIATGLLSQEKRLQAIEQRLSEMSSAQTATTQYAAHPPPPPPLPPSTTVARTQAREGWRGSLVKTQQSLDERLELPLDTRMRYLEEDVVDNWYLMNENLKGVRDQASEMVRKESEDFGELHRELAEDVNILEGEINATREKLEADIKIVNERVDSVETEVERNTHRYYRVNDGLHRVINYIREVEDQLWLLRWEVEDMNITLRELVLRHEEEENRVGPGPQGPNVGPIVQSGRVMGKAKQAVMDWLNEEQSLSGAASNRGEQAQAQSKPDESDGESIMSSFEELLNELMKYNM